MAWKPPKILLGGPTAVVKQYCADEWIENIRRIIYPAKIDIFLADNSEDDSNVEFWKSRGVECERVRFSKTEPIIARITKSHNLVRQKALEGGYDFLFHVETDVFPSPDVLIRLLSHRKAVTSVSYDIFDMHDREPVMLQIEDEYDGEAHAAIKRGKYILTEYDGTLKQAWANGIGCILIHRSVLEKFEFRYDKDRDGFCDSWLAYDLRAMGIPVHVDTSMYAYHKNKDWRNFGDEFVSKVHTNFE